MSWNRKSKLLRLALSLMACVLLVSAAGCVLAEEDELADENLFNKKDPFYVEGYNFVQSTSEVTAEENSFITGYIPVSAGDLINLNLNHPQSSEFVKYATYDPDQNWLDTIRTNNVSEMSIRIFEDGYLRISVYGLEFKEDMTIFRSAASNVPVDAIPETLLMSSNNTNVLVQTSEEDPESYTKDWLDRYDPDFMDKCNFVQFTDVIVEESDSFISGYIPVNAGDAVTLDVGLERDSPFIKYALYDKDKNWLKTYRFNYTSTVTVTIQDPGFIRFSVSGRLFKSTAYVAIHPTARLAADTKIDDIILPALADTAGYLETFNRNYMSDELVDLFNQNDEDFEMDKGFRQLTDEVVDDTGSFLTGYIPVVSDQVLIVNITETCDFVKYAMYDENKNWINTTRVDNPTVLVVPIEQAGYFRFHGRTTAINGTSISVPSVRKLDISAVSGNIDTRLERLEQELNVQTKVDVIIFMGQSNMAGRGIVTDEHPEDAPEVIEGAGWEFRAVTDPTTLHPIDKYFGLNENVEGAINDGAWKTGGMIPAFINAYYTNNGNVPVVGISASEGSTSITNWQPDTPRLNDALNRLQTCLQWLKDNNYEIRHTYMLWCQGENDDDHSETWYTSSFNALLRRMQGAGVEKCLMIRVGNSNPMKEGRISLMTYQNHICRTNPDAIMISLDLSSMLERGLMKDDEHYFQEGYNELGEQAGINAAYYVTTKKEPVMYDPQFDELYYSVIN